MQGSATFADPFASMCAVSYNSGTNTDNETHDIVVFRDCHAWSQSR